MNVSRILPFFVTTIGFVTATTTVDVDRNKADVQQQQQQQQLLRKVMEDNIPHPGRHLQIFNNIFDPCPIIESQFPSGQVSCECNVALTSGKIDYVCNWSDTVCVGASDTLGFCGTPVYSGTLNLFQLQVENKVCIQDVTAIGNFLNLNDFCVQLIVQPRNDQIISCRATFGTTTCSRCVPCPGGGLTLDCQNVASGATNDNTCTTPLRTVTRLMNKKKNQLAITTPFVPNFSFLN